MNINEAIWKLRDFRIIVCDEITEQHREAIELGIEALKRIKEYRAYKHFAHTTDLPGETED